jgi:hypothetical protein
MKEARLKRVAKMVFWVIAIPDDTRGLYSKQVTIVIYDRNDSGQYYKTTIMIIIDDPSLS